jgi:hypothetical protein
MSTDRFVTHVHGLSQSTSNISMQRRPRVAMQVCGYGKGVVVVTFETCYSRGYIG